MKKLTILFISLIFSLSLFASGKIGFRIEWEATWDTNIHAMGEEGYKFVEVNNYEVPFYTDDSTVKKASNNRVTYSEMNGEAPSSKFIVGDNHIKFHFATTTGEPVNATEYTSKLYIKRRGGYSDKPVCDIKMKTGEIENGCDKNIPMSYEVIDPKGYAELVELKRKIDEFRKAVGEELTKDRDLREKLDKLKKEIDKILEGDLDDINPDDFIGLISDEAVQALKDAKAAKTAKEDDVEEFGLETDEYEKSVDELEEAVNKAFDKLKKEIYDINNTLSEDLLDDNINPEESSLTEFGIVEITEEEISMPSLDSDEEIDQEDNIYKQQADETIAALEQALADGDRELFIYIAHAWSSNQTEILPIIEGRKGIIKGELEAYLTNTERVREFITQHLDLDGYFRDSLPGKEPEIKDAINNIGEMFPDAAGDIKKETNMWSEEFQKQMSAKDAEFSKSVVKGLKALGHVLYQIKHNYTFENQEEEDNLVQELESLTEDAKHTIHEMNRLGKGWYGVYATVKAGDFADFTELITGKDFATGEELSTGQHILSGASLFIFGSRPVWEFLGAAVGSIGQKAGRAIGVLADEVKDAINALSKSGHPVTKLLTKSGVKIAKFQKKLFSLKKNIHGTLSETVEIYRCDRLDIGDGKGGAIEQLSTGYSQKYPLWGIHKGNIDAPHRFSGKTYGGLYFSSAEDVAAREAKHYNLTDFKDSKFIITKAEVKLDELLDLTVPSKVKKLLGIDISELVRVAGTKKENYAITQLIGEIARKKGFKGIKFKSARSDLSVKGYNYVIFADKPIDAVIKPKNVSYKLKPVGVDY